MQLKLHSLKNNEIYSSIVNASKGPFVLEWNDLSLIQKALEENSISDSELETLLFGTEATPVFSGFTEKRVLRFIEQLSKNKMGVVSTSRFSKSISFENFNVDSQLQSILQENLAKLRTRNLRKRVRAKSKEWLHRIKEPFSSSLLNSENLRLNLGAGEENYPGYVKVDWAGPQQLFDDIVTLKKIQDNCVSEIYSNHVLEHIPQFLVIPMLKRWHQVLKPGGTLQLRMPDAKQAILNLGKTWTEVSPSKTKELGFPDYLAKESTLSGVVDDDLAIQFIYGWSDSMPNHWDMSNQHKSLWTPFLGKHRLEAAGFKVERAENFGTLQTVLIANK